MSQEHDFSPSWELVKRWSCHKAEEPAVFDNWLSIARQAAQWGADQELEACCKYILDDGKWFATPDWSLAKLRAARRPKPPSLKEQALKMLRPLSNPVMPGTPEYRLYEPQAATIRRALESIPD